MAVPLLVLLATACSDGRRGRAPPDAPAVELLRSLAIYRPFEARPGLVTSPAPCEAGLEPPAGSPAPPGCIRLPEVGSDPFLRIARLASAVRSERRTSSSAARLRALGLLDAAWAGDDLRAYDRAIARLEDALAIGPAGPELPTEILTDLSAVRHARFGISRDPEDLIAALSHAEWALSDDEAFAPALFNRALALQDLYLVRQADLAWAGYLERDSSSAWAAEARLRRGRLQLRRGSDAGAEALRRRALDELLPAWGRARLAGATTGAAAHLTEARALGERLAAENGAWSVLDVVAAIERAPDDAIGDRLAEALDTYGRARVLFSEGGFDRSHPLFLRADRLWPARAGVNFPWAPLGAASVEVYRAEYGSADRRFRAVADSTDPRRHPIASALAHWGLGVSLGRRNRLAAAVGHYDRAAALYEAAGAVTGLAGAHFLLGEAYGFLGERRRSLRHVHRALDALAASEDPSVLHNLMLIAAGFLAERHPLAAIHFHREGLAAAERLPRAQAPVEARIRMARTQAQAGRFAAAERTLARARRDLERVADPIMRPRLESEYMEAIGLVRLAAAPEGAVEPLSRAADYYRARGLRVNLIPVLRGRALARLDLGRIGTAREDLLEVVRLVDEERAGIRNHALRLSLVESVSGAYDALIALEVDGGRPGAALELLERSRASLWSVSSSPGAAPADPWRREERLGPPEATTLLEFAALPDRVLIWVLRPDTIVLREQPWPRAELRREIDELGAHLRRAGQAGAGRVGAARARAEALYRRLIGTVADVLPDSGELVIVPDRMLHRLPFAALIDPATGEYLIEKYVIRYSPTARMATPRLAEKSAMQGLPGMTGSSRSPPRSLIVSVPVPDPDRFPELEPLHAAETAARATAGLLPAPTLLEGAGATPAAVEARLGAADLFHFAGHARYDAERPERSELVLAAPSAGVGRSESVLSAERIAAMELDGLRLVVLSACSTMVPGETRTGGLSGLARAFLSAGAGGVVGSLWPVRDRATADLMREFYAALAGGLEPGAALRAAQLAMLGDDRPDRRSPGVWSVFRYEGA